MIIRQHGKKTCLDDLSREDTISGLSYSATLKPAKLGKPGRAYGICRRCAHGEIGAEKSLAASHLRVPLQAGFRVQSAMTRHVH